MQYTIKCEKCGRPGTIAKQICDEKQKKIHTVYKSTCECGGKIKPILD